MADVLVDTDVFIDHLRGARELEAGRHRLHCSVVTRAELFAERAGRIRREHGTRLPDALIAASAIQSGLSVMTRDVEGFDGIRQVRLHPTG